MQQRFIEAIHLYNETRYEANRSRCGKTCLRLNQLSVLAHNGLAKNYLQTEDYELAAYHFEIAGNRALYSEAFWEIRNLWLQANLITMIGSALHRRVRSRNSKPFDKRKHIFAGVRTAWFRQSSSASASSKTFSTPKRSRANHPTLSMRIKRGHKGSYARRDLASWSSPSCRICFRSREGLHLPNRGRQKPRFVKHRLGFRHLSGLVRAYAVSS
jgi:hypothetical protein